jgi:hypothetical protein
MAASSLAFFAALTASFSRFSTSMIARAAASATVSSGSLSESRLQTCFKRFPCLNSKHEQTVVKQQIELVFHVDSVFDFHLFLIDIANVNSASKCRQIVTLGVF